MKFLAFTDTHGSPKAMDTCLKKANRYKVDAMICAGDVSVFEHNLDLILHDLNNFGYPMFIIHGNHEYEETFAELCDQYENLHNIHEKAYVDSESKLAIIGYGGGGFSTIDKRFEKIVKKLLKKIPEDYKIILVTHAPPYGKKVDIVMGDHCGCKSISDLIAKTKRITVSIAGHLHECEGETDKIGKTKLMNPGRTGRVVKI